MFTILLIYACWLTTVMRCGSYFGIKHFFTFGTFKLHQSICCAGVFYCCNPFTTVLFFGNFPVRLLVGATGTIAFVPQYSFLLACWIGTGIPAAHLMPKTGTGFFRVVFIADQTMQIRNGTMLTVLLLYARWLTTVMRCRSHFGSRYIAALGTLKFHQSISSAGVISCSRPRITVIFFVKIPSLGLAALAFSLFIPAVFMAGSPFDFPGTVILVIAAVIVNSSCFCSSTVSAIVSLRSFFLAGCRISVIPDTPAVGSFGEIFPLDVSTLAFSFLVSTTGMASSSFGFPSTVILVIAAVIVNSSCFCSSTVSAIVSLRSFFLAGCRISVIPDTPAVGSFGEIFPLDVSTLAFSFLVSTTGMASSSFGFPSTVILVIAAVIVHSSCCGSRTVSTVVFLCSLFLAGCRVSVIPDAPTMTKFGNCINVAATAVITSVFDSTSGGTGSSFFADLYFFMIVTGGHSRGNYGEHQDDKQRQEKQLLFQLFSILHYWSISIQKRVCFSQMNGGLYHRKHLHRIMFLTIYRHFRTEKIMLFVLRNCRVLNHLLPSFNKKPNTGERD